MNKSCIYHRLLSTLRNTMPQTSIKKSPRKVCEFGYTETSHGARDLQLETELCSAPKKVASWRFVVELISWRALATSSIEGRFSGIKEVHWRAMSRASSICCRECSETLGSRTWEAPLAMFTFLLTHWTTSRESSVDSNRSACLPVKSSSNTTPKLYTSICSVAFLLYLYSVLKMIIEIWLFRYHFTYPWILY